MSKLPLSGYRVLDLTNVLAGPYCCYQLALMGAEVIKVERPQGGDLARQLGASVERNRDLMGASFLAQNGAKQSLCLDLKSEQGRKVLLRLVESADVLVENFRPGVMDKLGLGYETLRQTNPGLVYCAISGFGQTGPLRDNPAYDQIIQGLSGIMSVTGDRDSAPLRVGFPVSDTVGGMTAAFAVASALAGRGPDGEGRMIDVSMLEASLSVMAWSVSNFLIAGVTPAPMGNDNATASPSGAFRAGDGLLNIAANKQEQFEALARLVGQPEWLDDPRFAEREARKQHRAALTHALEGALASRSAREWAVLLNRAGIPSGEVLDVPAALAQPQIAARDLVHSYADNDGAARNVHVMGAGFLVDGKRPMPASPPRRLGADTTAILTALGYTDEDIASLRANGII
jgi:CoA:oxalate CoA-transferase